VDTKLLLKFRNYLPSKEMVLADRLILERGWHPDIEYVLRNPPEAPCKFRVMTLKDRNRLHQLVMELRLQIDIERGDYS
jgi:hypothetical protein